MGAKQSKDNIENEFIFENPLLQTTTFELPPKEIENNNEIPKKSNKTTNVEKNVNSLPTTDTKEVNSIYDSDNNIKNENKSEFKLENNETNEVNNLYDSDNNIKNEEKSEFKLETNETNEINNLYDSDNNITNEEKSEFKLETNNIDTDNINNKEDKNVKDVKDNKKDKKIYTEEPLPKADDSYKPLDLIKPDEILSPETVENLIEEHVKEELYLIQNEYKIKNFKRDKLLERTINIMKYGNSNFNYKDINDKYRKSQKKVLECMSNNSECTLSERDIACYQEFEEFKVNIRNIYKKYYNA
ncbi:hypothetical protein H8356DRAFT_1660256 [Neocallimastix lanati (nom. inval.)]|jgi:hypothetical protein|uniref:Uncharacterized protein n=1 Tax=Neocallimastix californiae TaxID=1754190 RepID=A0A1Y2AHU7_9FUNG|nr:hypothetical protein H8356DRAFT_1660256 [Neocallimastix sp. JGI-2020a]ORY21535.1 hypothetical protein LY90DRAFT_707408 [Neocallimastix californiae]|eukprot:ORY21535.1 hypothetical protein LY90DRAFT_707408 [Neocallimastix californiae]